MLCIRQHQFICNKLISPRRIYQSSYDIKNFFLSDSKGSFYSKHWVAREIGTKLEGESRSDKDVFVWMLLVSFF